MSVTAVPATVPPTVPPTAPPPVASPAPAVVDAMVGRLHTEYGVDRYELGRLAAAAFGTFATARVQTFVPILVEKRLRAACRLLRDAAPPAR